MHFWSFICNHNITITLIALAWIIGVMAGRKMSGIRTIFIKNPFAGKKSAIVDDTSPNMDPLRFKREYVINLIVNKKKDFPYDDISAFTVSLEDIIENNQLKAYTVSNTRKSRKKKAVPKVKDLMIKEDSEINETDLHEVVNPNSYGQ